MERKVRTIRLWLLTVVVVALGLWEPALWFGVPLFFFPTCACCGLTCIGCPGTAPEQLQVDITGATNAACTGCASFNASHILDYLAGGNSCTVGGYGCAWQFSDTGVLYCPALSLCVGAGIDASTKLEVVAGTTGQEYRFRTAAAVADCAFSGTNVPSTAVGGFNCAGTPTCTVTAL